MLALTVLTKNRKNSSDIFIVPLYGNTTKTLENGIAVILAKR